MLQIVRDRRSGESLQYAFIEFDNAKSCENAFFKMDNVLIDDRRIHVDFSQSVSQNYKYKPSEFFFLKNKFFSEISRFFSVFKIMKLKKIIFFKQKFLFFVSDFSKNLKN